VFIATFTILSNKKNEKTYAKFIDVLTIYKASEEELKNKLSQFLNKNNLSVNDIDVVITGNNGDYNSDRLYNNFVNKYLPEATQVVYKHLIGEHGSASAFGYWLGAKILKNREIPGVVNFSNKSPKQIRNVLVYNFDYYFKNNHSFVLLTSV
jgi:3-oxoacyl-(acyl-carrier-protein) synthase